jgi:hypothetical protein
MASGIKIEPNLESFAVQGLEDFIKTEAKIEAKFEAKIDLHNLKVENNEEKNPTPIKRKYCKLCQEHAGHSTSKCPSLICVTCGQKGHAKKDCKGPQKVKPVKNEVIQLMRKSRGRVKSFIEKSGQGTILTSKGQLWPFQQPGSHFKLGNFVVFDMNEAGEHAIDVCRVNDLIGKPIKTEPSCSGLEQAEVNSEIQTKIIEPSDQPSVAAKMSKLSLPICILGNDLIGKPIKTKPSCSSLVQAEVNFEIKTEIKAKIIEPMDQPSVAAKMSKLSLPICILDVHILMCEHNEQMTQLGAVVLDGQVVRNFFRPILPDETTFELSNSILRPLDIQKSGKIYFYDHVEKGQVPCWSEKRALKDFLDMIEENGSMGLYTSDLDIVLPKLMGKLDKYDMLAKFKSLIPWVCDLKSIVRSKELLRHFHSFCWSRFPLIYQHVMGTDFPFSKESASADMTAHFLWLVTEKILEAEDLQNCQEFYNYFFASKLLFSSNNSEQLFINNRKSVARLACVQSCAFDRSMKNISIIKY